MRSTIVFVCLFVLSACRAAGESLPGWAVDGIIIHVPAALAVSAGTPVRAVVSTSAPLGVVPVLSASNLPRGATFADRGDGAAWFLWTPATDQTGKLTLRFGADGDGEAVEATWAIEVTATRPGTTGGDTPLQGGGDDTDDTPAGNAVPSLSSAAITGASFTCSDTLRIVTQGWHDAEGAPEQVVVQWFINGAAVTDVAGRTLPAGRLTRGDAVYADVHPVDGVGFGAAVRTPTIEVRNAVPVALGVTFGLGPHTVTTAVRAWAAGCIDDDGDACDFRFTWSVNGAALGVTTAELSGALVTRGDVIGVAATPFDGIDEGLPVFAEPVTLENAPPVPSRLRIGPVGIKYDTAALSVSQLAAAADPDGDPITTAYRWFRNGALYAEGTSTPSLVDALRQGDVWVVEAVPADLESFGAPATAWVRVDLRRARAIAAGGAFTCAILNDGVTKCWGSNAYGQVGANLPGALTATPVAVMNLSSDSVSLAAGKEHACAVSYEGSLSCWGRNDMGQLGAAGADASAAQLVTGVTQEVRAVAAGAKHTCVVQGAGEVWCWGDNQLGQLGTAGVGSYWLRKVALAQPAKSIAAGTSHTCALLADHTVYCWGGNGDGQLGAPLSVAQSDQPLAVGDVTDAVSIAAGGSHTCVLRATSAASCWGSNASGQLGSGSTAAYSSVPVQVAGGAVYQAIVAGDAHTCAVRTDGFMACWGASNTHQLGTGTSSASPTATPQVLSSMPKTTGLAAGGNHTCGLTKGGAIKCWGSRVYGQVGDGTSSTTPRSTPYGVTGLSAVGAIDVAAGADHSCAVTAYGKVKCWGLGSSGQLGNGSFSATPVVRPTDVVGISDAVEVVAGDFHTCARLASGLVKCWGANGSGQLGNGTANSAVPLAITYYGTYAAVSVVAGSSFGCMLHTVSYLFCWGKIVRSPVSYSLADYSYGISRVGTGSEHICINQNQSNGTRSPGLYCLGDNTYGQLGNNSLTSSSTFVLANNLASHVHISGGYGHTCVDAGATYGIRCSGRGSMGQLSLGVKTSTKIFSTGAYGPGLPLPGNQSGLVSSGNSSCTWGSTLRCWGAPFLGDGTQSEALYARVVLVDEPVAQMASSFDELHEGLFGHTCASSASGTVFCWGYNRSGSVGQVTEQPILRPTELENSAFWW